MELPFRVAATVIADDNSMIFFKSHDYMRERFMPCLYLPQGDKLGMVGGDTKDNKQKTETCRRYSAMKSTFLTDIVSNQSKGS